VRLVNVGGVMDDYSWMRRAIELSRQCPASEIAFSVGAVIVDGDGLEIASGYSRETDPLVHAEEAALGKVVVGDPRLRAATMYSTLEPCSRRASRPTSCLQLILDAEIPRIVIAWHEPDLFVFGVQSVEALRAAGRSVLELSELAEEARAVNAHLLR
jgi:diaminohydroxyphosphoribosylaminopyrimidine deaminase/5-amino-6-(5-phosphoribosylamino)uracil reductase